MTEPMEVVPTASFLDSLGARGSRRAEPRASIAIAGAGCTLAVLGALVIAGDTGASDGDFNRVPGVVLSALVVAAGFVTLAAVRQGPLATAGVAAAALGVPPLVFFLTFDQGGLPPYSTNGILIVSTMTWLGAYAVGPGRARPFFLGAGLLGFWLTILQLTEHVFEAPFGLLGGFRSSSSASFGDSTGAIGGSSFDGGANGPSFHVPDPTTLGLVSLGLGLAYLLATRWLDKRGRHGVATPFALATLPTLFAGTLFLADDLEQAGTGLLALGIGAALAWHGASVGRRVTAWLGGAATAIGAGVFLGDMTDDATVGGMLFMAAGIGLVAAGHGISLALGEPDEMAVTSVGTVPVSALASDGAETSSPEAEQAQDADQAQWAPPTDDTPPPPPPPF
jgi:hypothetical protein